MKHCPDPDCPHVLSTARPAEFEDHVATCTDCGRALADGPAPENPIDTESLVSIAEFSTAHEAHIARAALASHGIAAVVDQDHSPYVSASAWVQLSVSSSDAALARQVLEQGPLQNEEVADGDEAGPTGADAAPADDLRPARVSRRFLLARWFLYAQAIGGILASVEIFGLTPIGIVSLVVAAMALALALWSKRRPRPAFAIGVGFQTAVTMAMVATQGPLGLMSLVPVLAMYFAWAAAAPDPADEILARPAPTRSAEADIGEAWKNATAPPENAAGPRIRWDRILGLVLVGSVIVAAGGWLRSSAWFQGLLRGTTHFVLVADTGSALSQELDLARARLGHELRQGRFEFESIEIVGPAAAPAIEITGVSLDAVEEVSAIVRALCTDWMLETGPGSLRAAPDAETRAAIVDTALDETLDELRSELGITADPEHRRTNGTIELQAKIPGTPSIEEIRGLVGSPTRLEITRVRYPHGEGAGDAWLPLPRRDDVVALFGGSLPAGTEVVRGTLPPQSSGYWPVESVPVVVGRDLVDAVVDVDPFGEFGFQFLLTEEAGKRLMAVTSSALGVRMALILRDDTGPRVVSAPSIVAPIGSRGYVAGDFTESQLEVLTRRMRAGARPMAVRVAGQDGHQ